MLELLKAVSDAPWAEEFPLNERKLARFLAPFGARPSEVRAGAEKGKGYKIEELEGVFASYLGPICDKGDNGDKPQEH